MKTKALALALLFLFSIGAVEANPINLRTNNNLPFTLRQGVETNSPFSLDDEMRRRRRRRKGGDFKMGAQAGFMIAGGFPAVTLGINGEYAVSEKVIPYGKFNLSLPSKDDFSCEVYSMNLSPNYDEISATEKVTFFYLTVGSKYNLIGGDSRDMFSFYGFAEIGLLFATDKIVYNEDVPAGYTAIYQEGTEGFSNYTIGGGIGIDLNVEVTNIFVELFLALPANQANGVAVPVEIGGAAGINAGVKFPLG